MSLPFRADLTAAPPVPPILGDRLGADLHCAANLIELEGWAKDCLHAPDGGHDVTGAIYVATGYHQRNDDGVWLAYPLEKSAGRRATECIAWMIRAAPARSLAEWNDRVCPSVEVLLSTMRQTAESGIRLLRTPRDIERLLS